MKISYKPALVILLIGGLSIFFKVNTGQMVAGFSKTDLEQVLSITEVSYDGTIDDLVKVTQKAWLLPRNKDCLHADSLHEDKREQLLPLFKNMWLIDEWINQKFTYDYILFQSVGVGCGFEERSETLKKLLGVPIHAREIAILLDNGPLTVTEKKLLTERGSKDIPATKAALYLHFFKEHGLPVDGMVLVDASPAQHKDSSWDCLATADAVKKWLTRRPTPQPGTILAISHQPFCNFDHLTLESLLPKGFIIRTVGKAAAADTRVAVYLDTIARTLYVWHEGNQKIKP